MPKLVTADPDQTDIARFRAFNRMYTRFIGVLDEELLNSNHNLIEARVLYELANGRSSAREIIDALGVDAGYLSRILAKFEATGLLQRERSSTDARSAKLALKPQGRAEFRKLDTLSSRQAAKILTSLTALERSDLIGSMDLIERTLNRTGSKPESVCTLREPKPGDVGWVIHREAVIYAQEYGFDRTYEALVAEIVADFAKNFNAQRERCWIAEVNGQNVGHVFLVQHRDRKNTARLRLLLVEPSARGLSVGTTLVEECVRFAREVGYRRISLWTQKDLVAAHRIYQKVGFKLIEEKPHHSFGKNLVAQTWELAF